MKKKNLKTALVCAALAVPTMFMATGCKDKTETISATEYTNLVYDAGSNYLKNHREYKTFGDMTINSQKSSTETTKETVEYKASATATEMSEKEVTITETTTANQVIEINRDETENGDIALKVTKTIARTEKGERANSETDLLENYEEKTDASEVYTFVKTGTAYKLFKYEKSVTKETGEEDSTNENKQVKTFADQEEFQSAIEGIISELDYDLVNALLSAGSISIPMFELDSEAYKGKDNFGMSFSGAMASRDNDDMGKVEIEGKYEYKNNLPYSINTTLKTASTDGESTTMDGTMTITYSAAAIAAPTDSADYTANESIDYSDVIEGFEI